MNHFKSQLPDVDPQETRDWVDSFDSVVTHHGPERGQFLLRTLLRRAQMGGAEMPTLIQTPYINTIPPEGEPPYPGDEDLELRLRRIIRWNSVLMVLRANKKYAGIGGHLATYASAATLYEVGFNHFFRGKTEVSDGDHIFFQGHASPGIYARALIEGRLTIEQFEHFRRECDGKGLSSYPHPRLMPDFWEHPTVSMGLGPLCAIYQARFNRYLRDRGIKDTASSRVWAFLGDGETDEPEALGSLSIAAREKLDNLIFVVNCNLQRLDGPVRGNGKIIQELEAVFHGAGWNVIKVIWGRGWDPLLANDHHGLLVKRMGEACDGDYQKYSTEPGSYTRQHFFGTDPRLLKMVEHLSDEQIHKLRRGGHDYRKVYAAYAAACAHQGSPTVILAKTVKGWTLGGAAEGKNVAHQQKKLTMDELRAFRDELHLPIDDTQLAEAPYFLPEKNSPEIRYLLERRRALGGFVPRRVVRAQPLETPGMEKFPKLLGGTGDKRPISTTTAFAQLLADLLRDPVIGRNIVPIIPDEARTFGLDALFSQYGIYSSGGQRYEPVDKSMLMYYREARDGQVIEEGITEAGSMASFIAAGTCHAAHALHMIPFYIFYSMFGYQRVGDLVWAHGDARGRGFLLGATAGRTTLNGEGLQHQDGHSHLLFNGVPNVMAYDPAYGYEIVTIIVDGLRRMYHDAEDIFYYLTLQNETYPMPGMPEGVGEGILRGMYRVSPAPAIEGAKVPRAQLFGSGSILRMVLGAQTILAEKYGVAADVWSVTSYPELRREALAAERANLLHPDQPPRIPYVTAQLQGAEGPVVAATDYMRALPDLIARWVPNGLTSLGTDGYGRSDTRDALRRHFEVDAECIALAALHQLSRRCSFPPARVAQAIQELGLDPEKVDPLLA